ncbi:sensor domain-containing diguanylate cyclase [Sporosarcina sp. 179-K 3D1 HS]|uniref:sensor domain-containing diguanylate cyclase n=1 Tax=Sporosarcina sp. 179-K 3D1 HS TaxID=3232169 RepID=UPI0039A2E866
MRMNHQLTMLTIKSELFDLWTEEAEAHSNGKWFESLRNILDRHFRIRASQFFIYYNESLIPLNGNDSNTNITLSIPMETKREYGSESDEEILADLRGKGYPFADDYILFRNTEGEPIGLLLLKSTNRLRAFAASPYWGELQNSIRQLVQNVRKTYLLEKKEESYRQLFNVTEIFNATMESRVILDAIVQTVSESFPEFQVDLLLSHERQELSRAYQLFDHTNERPSALDAFLSGELTVERAQDLAKTLVNAPIKGRQGIYGVLQLQAPIEFDFNSMQKDFIRVVANTAGNALENASLYDQSHRLIADLQLVNETSRKLNENLNFDEMVLFLKGQLIRAFKPSELAFVFKEEGERFSTSDMSTSFFQESRCRPYLKYALCQFDSGKREVFDANFEVAVGEEAPYKSFIAIPIMNQEEMIGFVILVHKERYYFPFDSFKLMRSLIGHSSLAFSNSMLRDQLQELVDKDNLTKLYTRSYLDKVIERSMAHDKKGVFLMIDVDNFKKVNDTYGHAIGDKVLRNISRTVLTEVGENGFAARWGGEEMAIYFPSEDAAGGQALADQLLRLIPNSTEPSVTVSIGMRDWSRDNKPSFQQLFQEADEALYEAKHNGKNQVVIYKAVSTNS